MAVIDFASMQQPPSTVEVPAQRNILLSAVGGSGEPGRTGGNGEDGLDGIPGVAATRESDATVSYYHLLLYFVECYSGVE